MIPMTDVTRILNLIEAGDPAAADDLLPLVYDELRKLAGERMRLEKPGHSLNATALVHEAYLRLVGNENGQNWDSKGHFFGSAAEAMRRILIDKARRDRRPKHGGDLQRVDFEESLVVGQTRADELLALDEAIEKLSAEAPEKASLVKLRYFAGLSHQEAAQALGISRTTADRYWSYAKAFIYLELQE
jgi:RNA polymerase sigma factor (TIGR02999 family)